MAFFLSRDEYRFEDHPLFQKVKLAKLAGKTQHAPVGISMLELEPAAEIPVHTHEKSIDSIYIMSGEAEIYADGRWRSAAAGDYCFIPVGEEHGVRNRGDRQLSLFIVHSPPLF